MDVIRILTAPEYLPNGDIVAICGHLFGNRSVWPDDHTTWHVAIFAEKKERPSWSRPQTWLGLHYACSSRRRNRSTKTVAQAVHYQLYTIAAVFQKGLRVESISSSAIDGNRVREGVTAACTQLGKETCSWHVSLLPQVDRLPQTGGKINHNKNLWHVNFTWVSRWKNLLFINTSRAGAG